MTGRAAAVQQFRSIRRTRSSASSSSGKQMVNAGEPRVVPRSTGRAVEIEGQNRELGQFIVEPQLLSRQQDRTEQIGS